jgi:ABC-type branched-subunit amino acid transport system ATPase component/ABC-type branched-subunit amino acid transport system permease subunit
MRIPALKAILGRGLSAKWVPALVPVALCLLPLVSPSPQHFEWGAVGLLWGLWVLSLNIVWGYAGQLSLAQLGLGAIGAYAFTLLTARAGGSVLLALIAGVGLAFVASLALSVAALRLRGFYFTILTVTFALVILTVIANSELTGRSAGLLVLRSVLPTIDLFGVQWEMASRTGGFFALVAVVFLLMNAIALYLARSSAGRAMLAVRDDEQLAASLGMNALHIKTIAFVVSSIVAGTAGIMQALKFQLVVPELFSLDQALIAVLLLVLAGLASVWAPAIAAAVYVALYEAAPINGSLRGGLLGAVVVLIILFFPGGIAGAVTQALPLLRRLVRHLPAAAPQAGSPDATQNRQPPDGSREVSERSTSRLPVREAPAGVMVDQTKPLLSVRGIVRRFGGIVAVNDVSFDVEPGMILGLVGPNGAGKTTLINILSGFDSSSSGSFALRGIEVAGWAPHRLARVGLVRTFQHAHVFSSMTVTEALLAAGHVIEGGHLTVAVRGLLPNRSARGEASTLADRIVTQLHLTQWAHTRCGVLPYGLKKRLAIGLAMMLKPALLLLDEPAAGLNTLETRELIEHIQRLNQDGLTMLIVEHNMPLIMSVSWRVVVMDHGVKMAEGSPSAIANDPNVVGAYLGKR